MFCTECGTENNPIARFCYKCGQKIQTEQEPPASLTLDAQTAPTEPLHPEPYTPEFLRARQPKPGFIKMHWQGDFSLGISYWVIGALLTLLTLALLTWLGSSQWPKELEPRLAGGLTIGLLVFLLALTVWQFVGIWRSAGKHTQRGGKAAWATIAKLMIVLGLFRTVGEFRTEVWPFLQESGRMLAGIENTAPYQLHLLRDGTELELAGGMPFGTSEAMQTMLDASPNIKVIHLNSQGGRIQEAYKLYKLIQDRHLITYASSDCASACSIVFLAGQERYVGENGRLGFHSTSIGGVGGEVIKDLNNDVRQTMKAHQVPDEFIERALATPPDNVWYPTHEELLNAKVIDSVVDSRYYGLSGVGQWLNAHKIESGLQEMPLYAALSKYDPQNYAKLRELIVRGIQEGRPMAEIQNRFREEFLGPMLPQYMIKAPDDVLIRYWRSQIAEMKYLAQLNPQYCADFAFPSNAKAPLDLQRLLPKELLKDDLDSLAALVKEAAVSPQTFTPNAAIEADLATAFIQANHRYPGALEVWQRPEAFKNDPVAQCKATLGLYLAILDLPSAPRTGGALRYLVNQ